MSERPTNLTDRVTLLESQLELLRHAVDLLKDPRGSLEKGCSVCEQIRRVLRASE